jgi:hypothetical protein
MLSYWAWVIICWQPSGSTGELGKLYEQRERIVLQALKQDQIWRNPMHRADLLAFLDEAKLLRSSSFAAILVKRIDYDAYPLQPSPPRLSVEQQYPAFGLLAEIGMPATSAILEEMKGAKIEQRRMNFLVLAMVRIYERGGFGKELARKRIELEAERGKGEERERLIQVLKHARLN